MSTPQFTPEQLDYVLQFRHPEKLLNLLPGVSDETMALLEGLDVTHYRAIRSAFAERAREAAQALLSDPEIAAHCAALPFKQGQTVVGFGDSITDDLQSWLEILRYMVAIQRPQESIRFVNLGYSGDTTTHAFCRLGVAAAESPDWIICMLGTNDARLHGRKPSKILVSAGETELNLEMLRNFAATETNARWIWMTPAGVIEEQIRGHWLLGEFALAWRNADLDVIADLVRARPEPVVDLQAAFGQPTPPALMLDDGLHPSLDGQIAIVRALLPVLATQ